jgi:ATP-dependent DNA ligase
MRTTRLRASGDGKESHFIRPGDAYLGHMQLPQFAPAIPTRGTSVPSSPEWIHEIKYDGFRLISPRR